VAGVPGRSGGGNRRPPAEHRLRGTYRADRHGPLPEDPDTPAAPSVEPMAAPPALKGAALKHWRYFAPLLASARVLTPSDIETLADYCRACAAVEDRDRRLDQQMRKRQIDWSLQGKLDRELRGWIERKTRLAGDLGLTAVARTRVAWSGHHQRPSATPAGGPAKPQTTLARLQEQAVELRRPVGVTERPGR
jgi:phage terminase small subunit